MGLIILSVDSTQRCRSGFSQADTQKWLSGRSEEQPRLSNAATIARARNDQIEGRAAFGASRSNAELGIDTILSAMATVLRSSHISGRLLQMGSLVTRNKILGSFVTARVRYTAASPLPLTSAYQPRRKSGSLQVESASAAVAANSTATCKWPSAYRQREKAKKEYATS